MPIAVADGRASNANEDHADGSAHLVVERSFRRSTCFNLERIGAALEYEIGHNGQSVAKP